jgi:hypothetical protein
MASAAAKAEIPASHLEAMKSHREGEHERPLELDRHVSYPGHQRARAPMTYSPGVPGHRARFHCKLCPGKVFPIGIEDYAETEAQELWLLRNPGLAAGVRRLPAEDRAQAIAAYASGEVTEHAFQQLLRTRLQRTANKGRPAATRRMKACQGYMLEAYGQLGTVEQVLDSLLEMHRDAPERWLELTGASHPLSESTLRRYWRLIPRATRERVRAAYRAKPESERRREQAARRVAEMTP